MIIKQQLINDTPFKYGKSNKKLFITIHETDNWNHNAGAQAHANLQSNGNSRRASWHWQVDDKEAIQSFTHDFQLWAGGDGDTGNGNLNSIHIEICVNSNSNYVKAVQNAAELTKKIMKDENIPASNVVQHNRWSGKHCPRQMRDGNKGVTWAQFKAMLVTDSKTPATPEPPKKPVTASKTIAQMASEVIAGIHGNGHDARMKSLGISLADYEKVRNEVNRLSGVKPAAPKKTIAQMAKEVIDGKHGNGHTARQKSLGISNEEYTQVRNEVNKILGGKVATPKKSLNQMVAEVIAGKHGNGHAARQKSLGLNNAEYAKVRAEVNKKLK